MNNLYRIEIWLDNALEIEKLGMAFYETAANKATDWLMSDFFSNMVSQEKLHISILDDLARSFAENEYFSWPETSGMGPAGRGLQKLFNYMAQNIVQPDEESVQILEEGICIEYEAIRFYEKAIPFALGEAEARLLSALAKEEREHWQVLNDMRVYYADCAPQGLMDEVCRFMEK